MLKNFRKNNFYLVTYELKQLAAISLGISILSIWNPWEFESITQLILISAPLLLSAPFGYFITSLLVSYYFNPFGDFNFLSSGLLCLSGICFGFVHSQLVHFCSHNLLRPKWVNRALGEVLSLQFFGTYLGFTALHIEHHAHADDLVRDPHSNQSEGFLRFFVRLTQTMAIGFKKIYFNHHGNKVDTEKNWKRYKLLVPTRCFSRVIFLLLCLGPSGFLFFLLPSMLANYWVFGHLNYYSHLRKKDGTVEILNLNQKFSHRILNIFTLGAYNHADHHNAPNIIHSIKSKKAS